MTTPPPTDRTVPRVPPAARRWALVLGVVAVFASAVGCSGNRSGGPSWPWRDREKERRLAEKYGTTAKQRIETLHADANEARAAGAERQIAYTELLARRILEEHDPRVRCEIVATAGSFDTPAAAAICRGALQDPEPRVRSQACDTWRERGGPDAVALLTARYRADTDLDVRLRALRMLGELKDKGAIPTLAEALENPDPAVQYRAVAALKQVSGRDLGNDVNVWREWATDPEAQRSEVTLAERLRVLF